MLDMEERKNFFRKIRPNLPSVAFFPMMVEVEFGQSAFQRLSMAVKYFIASAIQSIGLSVEGSIEDESFLEANFYSIKKCPNVTPNGIILPKIENYLEFNIIQRTIAEILENTGLSNHLEKIHLPVSVRLVNGIFNPELHARPFAATKLHTEIWSGHPNDGVISFPICGDLAGTMPEFFEPVAPKADFVSVFDDYDDAKDTYEDLIKYEADLVPGNYYLYDAFVVHRTVKRGGGPRISVDFALTYERDWTRDYSLPTDRLINYIPTADWLKIGREQVVFEPESFADIKARLAAESNSSSPKRVYAAQGLKRIILAD